MGLDQKGTPVFTVKPGPTGQWNVMEEGFDKPLASFDDPEDAREYAQGLADTKEGSRVRVFDENGDEKNRMGMDDAAKGGL
jgi:hypothetical protein